MGISVSLSEHEVHWRAFLEHLKERGLQRMQLIISDNHAGLRAACIAIFGGLPWQRCQFHLQQNAQAFVLRKDMRRVALMPKIKSNRSRKRPCPRSWFLICAIFFIRRIGSTKFIKSNEHILFSYVLCSQRTQQ
ncbi:hypothetical protein B5M50_05615 [candidate division KSB1 bacterium 4484_219]|nr:MAG: hypothetical protein B5M50_05615 [candidate division KSB1 bacterium 4484_219]HEY61544.1 hypothetical protein [Anaerolineae bacterium]